MSTVRCGWPEQPADFRARYPDAERRHAEHATLGECDAWICSCGNEAHLDGFLLSGNDPDIARDLGPDVLTCGGCGQLYTLDGRPIG